MTGHEHLAAAQQWARWAEERDQSGTGDVQPTAAAAAAIAQAHATIALAIANGLVQLCGATNDDARCTLVEGHRQHHEDETTGYWWPLG